MRGQICVVRDGTDITPAWAVNLGLNVKAMAAVTLLFLQTFAGAAISAGQIGGTATPIKHVVIIMMENHSFDNVFGLYPTMNRTQAGTIMGSLQRPDGVLDAPKDVALSQVPNGTSWTVNPVEGVYPADWDNGRMDGFASNSGAQAMTFFGPSQLAVEWDWAEEYAIADRYFASCLCMTNPNRMFSLAGYGAGLTDDSGPPPYIPVNQSIFTELKSDGVSWGYYMHDPSADIFPLNYFDGIGAFSSQIQSFDAFYGALQNGGLPSVSWVMPVGGGAAGIDQHPEDNVTYGQGWLLGIVNRVMQSEYWNTTAIFVTYDEGGGYYDHVPPPVVAGVRLGFRVPLWVISPYSKENYVSGTVMNHASILAFIDYNWRLPALNSFVASAGLPLDMFNFNQTYPDGTLTRPPVLFQPWSRYPANLQVQLGSLPYQRNGSTTATLGSLRIGVYVSSNSTTTPFYQTLPFVTVVAVVLLAVGYYASRRARKSRK